MENPEPAQPRRPGVRGPDKRKRQVFYPKRHAERYRRKGGLKPGQRPVNSYPSKLTEADVKWIKGVIRLDRRAMRRRTGALQRTRVTPGLFDRIAARFGVTRWCIQSLDKGRTWKLVKAKRFTER